MRTTRGACASGSVVWPSIGVFVSPLQRVRRTCELAGFGIRAVSIADLTEWDYGSYEGRGTDEIRRERPGWHLFADFHGARNLPN